MSDFENIILNEMQIEGKEFTFLNDNNEDKVLNINSKCYGNFAFNFGLSKDGDESKEISISIWAGDNKKVGLLNFGFREKLQSDLTLIKMFQLIEFSINLVNPFYATVISNELRRKVKRQNEKCWIGWINYFSNKAVFNLLPRDVEKKVLPNGGVIFWLSEEKAVSVEAKTVQKAIQIRNILDGKGLLNYSL